MVGLLDRRLLFVTGKGGVGKTTVAAGLALYAAEHGRRTLVCEMDAKGDVAAYFETGPDQLRGPRGVPVAVGDVDGHRGVAAGVPAAQSADPHRGPDRAPGQGVRLRGHRRPGRAGDPHGGEVLLRGAGEALRPRGGRRLCHRPHRRAAGRAPGHQRPREGGADPVADGLDPRHPVGRRHDGPRHRHHPRGDARQRDHRAGGPGRSRDLGGARGGDREPGAARAVRAQRGDGVQRAVPARGLRRAQEARPGTTPPPSSTRRAWRSLCVGPGRSTSSACGKESIPSCR